VLAAEFAVIPPAKATFSPLFNLSARSSDTRERRIVVASVWRQRFALCPAHMGKRSRRSVFSATPERLFMRNLCEDSPPSGPRMIGYSVPSRFGPVSSIGTENRRKPRNRPVTDRVYRKCHAVRSANAPCFSLSTAGDGGQTLFVSVEEGVRSPRSSTNDHPRPLGGWLGDWFPRPRGMPGVRSDTVPCPIVPFDTS
jgi:hypothetical protein